MDTPPHQAAVHLPRVAITFCTQCRWMLRAAYFGQELLSTFGTSIGEIALIPGTGGLFTVRLTYKPTTGTDDKVKQVLIWDRKTEGGFPETKILKQLIRNHIEPEKKLGHSDGPASANKGVAKTEARADTAESNGGDGAGAAAPEITTSGATDAGPSAADQSSAQECEDCK
ncbi:hypothetical protein LTR62_005484 [Meristemomyces frigidus]|uniref:Rdx family-domain-containing protein n=1 Tax=Meristemomyces frigidus TaxID=1508187 RepID=A0AAN7TDJ7_9PEZI|nr:hypothetical protein LTR62_005484 [Meristemomyces frigidus]